LLKGAPASEWKKRLRVESGDTLVCLWYSISRRRLSAQYTACGPEHGPRTAKRFARLKAAKCWTSSWATNGELNALKNQATNLETLRLGREGES